MATLTGPQGHEIGQIPLGGSLAQFLGQEQLQRKTGQIDFVRVQFVDQAVAQYPANAAGEHAAQGGGDFATLAQQRLVGGRRAAFRASQERSAHLDARRAQYPSGGDAAPVHDAAAGDDGHPDVLGQQRDQGQDTDQPPFRVADEGTAMATGLGALGQR